MAAVPNGVEMVENGSNQPRDLSAYAQLEIAFILGFCPECCAGEIGAAQVHRSTVNDNCFGMHTRASANGQSIGYFLAQFLENEAAGDTAM